MCSHAKGSRGNKWVPLEEKHKGQMHKLKQKIQEEQGEVNCYV